jgi:asparagine synthase (glutamine-hydrolysing)
MCGIAGYINLSLKPVKDTSCIISMLKEQKHRGPDDSGIRAFNLESGKSLEFPTDKPHAIAECFNGIIGFNRLSILDLSMNGHQPFISPDNKVLLMLNGEIYNAFEIKPELEKDGYHFKSATDTEVVMALYLKVGFEKMISQLNGMFAIVIIDLKAGIIYIARDRFGIKPMYFIANDEILAFSSEIKSFRYLEKFRFDLDPEKLDEYLLFRNNLEGTLFKEIKTLHPGNYLTFSQDKGFTTHSYFNINLFQRHSNQNGVINDYIEKFESLLSCSVNSQLMSDVKLGCQLSGGIDSSVVTWFANRTAEKGQFESVSIVFDDKRYNEEPYIDQVAERLDIVSHKFVLRSDYYLDNIEKATWHFEAPINHPNTIGIYLLSQRAKEHVTVLLSGEGADEVFGGYRRYYDVSYPYLNTLFADKLRHGLKQPYDLADYFKRANRAIMATAFTSPDAAKILLPSFNLNRATSHRYLLYAGLTGSVFTKQVKYEMLSYLPDLLIRQDKMSMAHSIENRVPFLDNDVVKGSFEIPERFLLSRKSPEGFNTEKYLLKKAAADMFGQEFAFRGKMGFSIPVREFFSNTKFLDYLNDKTIPGMRARGILNSEPVEKWLKKINSITYHELESLWIALAFEIWASIYLDLEK